MSRSVPEWIGKTDDSKPSRTVKLRILRRYNESDYLTGIPFREGDKIQFDHIIALCNGGENRESNLAPTLAAKHKEKTARDVKERAKTDSRASGRFGIKRPSRPMPGSRASPWKCKINGPTERRGLMQDHTALIQRLRRIADGYEPTDYGVAVNLRDAAEALEGAERERDEARSTLSAWFDLSKKVEAEITPVLLGCLNGYLRTSENGGMPADKADLVRRTLSAVIDLYAGKALVPVLRGIHDNRAEAADARLAEARGILEMLADEPMFWGDASKRAIAWLSANGGDDDK